VADEADECEADEGAEDMLDEEDSGGVGRGESEGSQLAWRRRGRGNGRARGWSGEERSGRGTETEEKKRVKAILAHSGLMDLEVLKNSGGEWGGVAAQEPTLPRCWGTGEGRQGRTGAQYRRRLGPGRGAEGDQPARALDRNHLLSVRTDGTRAILGLVFGFCPHHLQNCCTSSPFLCWLGARAVQPPVLPMPRLAASSTAPRRLRPD